jgi:hypothetical protein
MKRICPSCKSELSVSSVYFCENCGDVLPEEIRIDSESHKNIKKIGTKKKKPKNSKVLKEYFLHFLSMISMRSVVLGFVLGIVVSILVFLFFETESFKYVSKFFRSRNFVSTEISSKADNPNQEVTPGEEVSSRELGLGIRSGPFGQYSVRKLIPYDASFYMEFNDTSTLEPYFGFIGGELFTLNENIKDNIEPFYTAFYMKKGIRGGWVVVAFLKDPTLDVGTYNDIFTDKVDGALIVSSEAVLIDEVKLAKSEVIKNLSMHPSLISMKPFLPDSGQILIVKIEKDGDDVVEQLEENTLSEEFKMVIESYFEAESPFFVVK